MSISSLAVAATERRPDVGNLDTTPRDLTDIADAVATNRVEARAESGAAVSNALTVIVSYIPTEVITIYVAALAVIRPTELLGLFLTFLILTPIALWLVFANQLKKEGKALPIPFRTWPLWEMFAATLAFTVWAFTLESHPPIEQVPGFGWYTQPVAGVVVLGVTVLLGLIAPLMQKRLGTS